MPHCWKGNDEYAAEKFGDWSEQHLEALENPATCMLEHGHDGPCDFVDDSRFGVTFGEK